MNLGQRSSVGTSPTLMPCKGSWHKGGGVSYIFVAQNGGVAQGDILMMFLSMKEKFTENMKVKIIEMSEEMELSYAQLEDVMD